MVFSASLVLFRFDSFVQLPSSRVRSHIGAGSCGLSEYTSKCNPELGFPKIVVLNRLARFFCNGGDRADLTASVLKMLAVGLGDKRILMEGGEQDKSIIWTCGSCKPGIQIT